MNFARPRRRAPYARGDKIKSSIIHIRVTDDIRTQVWETSERLGILPATLFREMLLEGLQRRRT